MRATSSTWRRWTPLPPPAWSVSTLRARPSTGSPQQALTGLSPSQAAGLAADLQAVLEGYAEEARERGEADDVDLAELREMLADVLFDDDYGEAVVEPRQHGATLEGAVALADALLARLAA